MYPGVINTQFHHLMYKNNLIKNKAREINNRSPRWMGDNRTIDNFSHKVPWDYVIPSVG